MSAKATSGRKQRDANKERVLGLVLGPRGHAAGARCDSLLEGATCCDDVWLHRVNKNA